MATTTQGLNMRTITRAEINPAPYNPRKNLQPGDADYEALRRSIERWGLVEPLVWNERSGNLVGGHQRFKILVARGDKTFDVSVVDLDPDDEAALNVALNKISGEWDMASLSALLAQLKEHDYDATLTGFDVSEIDEILAGKPGPDDDAPPLPVTPRSKLGEVYQLGVHRLMCGDATDPEHVATLLGGVEPHLMVTDPPYGVDYDPEWRLATGLNTPEQVTRKGTVTNDDRADWSEAWALFPGKVAYVWHGALHAAEVQASLEGVGLEIRSQIIWFKPNRPISRGNYHWAHEPCWYAVRKGSKAFWSGGRKQDTVWSIDTRPDRGDGISHATQKPLEAMRRPILNNSSPGQAVYEPFAGTGTTLVACEETERICFAMELDPGYCDVIRDRWERAYGEKAEAA